MSLPVADFTTDAPPGATCDLLATFGVSCQSCGVGLPTCVDLLITDLSAPEVPGAQLAVRSAADIAADPACAP